MAIATYYAKGQWKACCDQCGEVYKSNALRLQWNGLRTCPDCFELRNAQELLRMPRPEQPIPWSRNCEAGQSPCAPTVGGTRTLDSKLNDKISAD